MFKRVYVFQIYFSDNKQHKQQKAAGELVKKKRSDDKRPRKLTASAKNTATSAFIANCNYTLVSWPFKACYI